MEELTILKKELMKTKLLFFVNILTRAPRNAKLKTLKNYNINLILAA